MSAVHTYEEFLALEKMLLGNPKIHQRYWLNEKEIKALNLTLSSAFSPLAKYYAQPTLES